MKIEKIYKHIFGEIIKPKKHLQQVQTDIDDNSVFITIDGFFGFVLGKKDLPFNIDKISQHKTPLNLSHIVKPENLFKLTNNFIYVNRHGLINVLKNDNRKIYIKKEYLNFFDEHASFYQEKDFGIVIVVECGFIVGAICPFRINEETDV